MSMTDVKSFLLRYMRGNPEPTMLHPSEHPDFRTTTAGKRAEYARDLIGSDTFVEIIQFMNEEVVQEIHECGALDTDTLTVLKLRLQTISDFSFRLASFIDEYEAIKFEDFQEAQQRKADEEQEAA